MPRFGNPELGPFGSPPSAAQGTAFGISTSQPTDAGTPSSAIARSLGESFKVPTSLSLSCLSPNGRWVHSLAFQNDGALFIESHSLPLAGSTEVELASASCASAASSLQVVRTRLPQAVEGALERYPALELLCVDTDAPTPPGSFVKLPLLCLYTKKDAFVLDIVYHPVRGVSEIEGMVQSVSEPFEKILLDGSTALSIVRVRQGPQQWSGYSTMCPPECMALLAHDSSINEYSLHLHHGKGYEVTTPVTYGMEQIEDDSIEKITDFCFCQSNSFGALSSLCVAFLKGTGDVLIATPILFHGTVLSRSSISHSMGLLHAHLDSSAPNTAQWRRLKSAIQFLVDTFPDDGGKANYIAAQQTSASFEWPAQMQGPVLVPPETDDFETMAASIRPMYAVDMCGFAIGHVGDVVDFGIIAPTSLLPRFRLENPQDTFELDQALRWGAIVQRVDLSREPSFHQPNNPSVVLVHDPILNNVIHFVTPTNITSIASDSIKHSVNKIKERTRDVLASPGMFSPTTQAERSSPRTSVWSCLDISQARDIQHSVTIVGSSVSGDVRFGHVLVARLSDGSMIPVNLTETRHYHEMHALSDKSDGLANSVKRSSASESGLRSLQDTPPLYEILEPLFEKVSEGLGFMGKIVGSATRPNSISPEMLAIAMNIREHCDKEVLLPVLEMKEIVEKRKTELQGMYERQMAQLKILQDAAASMKEAANNITEQSETASENARSLAERSSSALQSSTDLIPTLTEAEYNYFNELKMLQEKTGLWAESIESGKVNALNLSDGIEAGSTAKHVTLEDEAATNALSMLKACGAKIEKNQGRLDKASDKVYALAAVARLDLNPEEPLSLTQ